jgi:hypothetical protein
MNEMLLHPQLQTNRKARGLTEPSRGGGESPAIRVAGVVGSRHGAIQRFSAKLDTALHMMFGQAQGGHPQHRIAPAGIVAWQQRV